MQRAQVAGGLLRFMVVRTHIARVSNFQVLHRRIRLNNRRKEICIIVLPPGDRTQRITCRQLCIGEVQVLCSYFQLPKGGRHGCIYFKQQGTGFGGSG